MRHPGAGQIMNVVMLVALLSAMNANIYGASRMAYSLVFRGQGPNFLNRVSGGVPRRRGARLSAFGFLAVLFSFWWPDTVFQWLLNMVGAAVLVVWGFIAVAQLRMRRRLEREAPEKLVVKMWAFPVLTWVALAGHRGRLAADAARGRTSASSCCSRRVSCVLALVGHRQRRAAAGAAKNAADGAGQGLSLADQTPPGTRRGGTSDRGPAPPPSLDGAGPRDRPMITSCW